MHPHHHTLSILEQELARAPLWFPKERKDEMSRTLESLRADPAVPIKKIEETLVAFGKEVWPYHKSLSHLHQQYAARREELLIREKLGANPALYKKFESYLAASHDIHEFKQGKEFDKFFEPEEWCILTDVTMSAHDQVMTEFQRECVSSRGEECNELVGRYKKEIQDISAKIEALKAMAQKSDKWRAEILEKARAFEEGWTAIERSPAPEDVSQLIEFYALAIEEGVV